MAKNFEDTMKELEKISAKLSSGDVTLEESIKLFEDGMKLSKSCQAMLEEAEKKVSILLENKDGNLEQKAFEGSEEE